MARNPKDKPVVIRRGRRYDPGPQLKLFEAEDWTGQEGVVRAPSEPEAKDAAITEPGTKGAASEPERKAVSTEHAKGTRDARTDGKKAESADGGGAAVTELGDPAVDQFCEQVARIIARIARTRKPKGNGDREDENAT